jgi:hypothetical protein
MENKNDGTLLLLLAAGFGVYWLTRKKTAANIGPVQPPISTQPVYNAPITEMPVIEQPKYVAPVIEQPIYNETVYDMLNKISQPSYDFVGIKEPVYNEMYNTMRDNKPYMDVPIYSQPVYNNQYTTPPVSTQPVYEQPVYEIPITEQTQYDSSTTVTDMFSTVWLPNYDNKTVIDPVLNENLLAIE